MKFFGLLFIFLSFVTFIDLAINSALDTDDDSKTAFVKIMVTVISFLLGVTLLAIDYFTNATS